MNYEFQAEKALFSLVAAQEGEAINEIFKMRSNEKSGVSDFLWAGRFDIV